jgi:hypothetical protein
MASIARYTVGPRRQSVRTALGAPTLFEGYPVIRIKHGETVVQSYATSEAAQAVADVLNAQAGQENTL